jgi:hypothetical protein
LENPASKNKRTIINVRSAVHFFLDWTHGQSLLCRARP